MNLNLPFFQQSLPLFTQSDAEMIDVLRHISREHDVIRDLIVALGELALSAKQGDLPQLLKTALSPKAELPQILKTALSTAPFVKSDMENFARWKAAQEGFAAAA